MQYLSEMFKRILIAGFVTLFVWASAGCERCEIRYYEIPKEKPEEPVLNWPPKAPAPAAAPRWSVPAGWRPGKCSPMRQASFTVEGEGGQRADISVIAIPGDAGGMAGNINRWRAQLGLGALPGDLARQTATRLEADGLVFSLVDFEGAARGKEHPKRIIAAAARHQENSWFFKMTGDAPLVGTQREAFLQFLRSVRF